MLENKLLISIIIQTVILIIFLAITHILLNKKTDIKKRSVSLFIALIFYLLLFLLYYYKITNSLLLFFFPLSLFIKNNSLMRNFFYYFPFLIINSLFNHNFWVLIFYVSFLYVTYLILNWITNSFYKHYSCIIISFVYLNLELFILRIPLLYYFMINSIAFFVWFIFLGIYLYFVELSKQNHESFQSKIMDRYTNTYNYYCLLNRSYSLLKNKKGKITIIIVNVDRLKDINMLYGKSTGDVVIKNVADIIKNSIKGFGEVYRLAGDSFCIVALNEKSNIMEILIEKIKLGVEVNNYIIDNNKVKVTVSIGGYFGNIVSKNIDDYIEIAEETMLKSKALGRNRFIFNNYMYFW